MEETEPVDQQLAAPRRLIAERPNLFARQGAVVATWRTGAGRRLGPYYALRYRDGGRQHSIYLGRSAEVAEAVRGLLAGAQQAFRRRRSLERIRALVKKSLRRHKRERWLGDLLQAGLTLRGFEIRRLPAETARSADSAISRQSAAGEEARKPCRPADADPSNSQGFAVSHRIPPYGRAKT